MRQKVDKYTTDKCLFDCDVTIRWQRGGGMNNRQRSLWLKWDKGEPNIQKWDKYAIEKHIFDEGETKRQSPEIAAEWQICIEGCWLLVTKVSTAQLHIHKYKLKSCTNLQLPACCLFIYLQKTEGKILPRAQQIQGLSSFAFVCVSVWNHCLHCTGD